MRSGPRRRSARARTRRASRWCARGRRVRATSCGSPAHSLPQRILASGDPYRDELCATATAVARAAGLERWSIAWQSAGRTADAWIGPDILDVLPEIAAAGAGGVVVCAAGFVADHLEVLYDLDIEAAAAARELGLAFARTVSPNADAGLVATLAD